jgi:maltose/moltooligosaccharide transporter
MAGVGIGWATILSMPYAMLADVIPPAKMGFYMGVFNFFIVLPQIVASAVLGPVVRHLFGGHALPAVVAGGVSLLAAAAALSLVSRDYARAA